MSSASVTSFLKKVPHITKLVSASKDNVEETINAIDSAVSFFEGVFGDTRSRVDLQDLSHLHDQIKSVMSVFSQARTVIELLSEVIYPINAGKDVEYESDEQKMVVQDNVSKMEEHISEMKEYANAAGSRLLTLLKHVRDVCDVCIETIDTAQKIKAELDAKEQ